MALGDRDKLVTVQTPTAVPDGEGGYTQTVVPATPSLWWCSIHPASQRDLERRAAGTVITSASHIVEGEYHPGITTATQLVRENGTILYVNAVQNPQERNETTVAFCSELLA